MHSASANWLILPVKPFGEGKSRLSSALTRTQRHELSKTLFQHALQRAIGSNLFSTVLVISRDPEARTIAEAGGAVPLCEPAVGLNPALEYARVHAVQHKARAIMVLPTDLPLLSEEDLAGMLRAGSGVDGVVIAPSYDNGTNAILLQPPLAIDFAFGQDSFDRHLALAQAAGHRVTTFTSASLALDVDRPHDLERLARVAPAFLGTACTL